MAREIREEMNKHTEENGILISHTENLLRVLWERDIAQAQLAIAEKTIQRIYDICEDTEEYNGARIAKAYFEEKK